MLIITILLCIFRIVAIIIDLTLLCHLLSVAASIKLLQNTFPQAPSYL